MSRKASPLVGRDGVKVVFWPLAYTDPETARGVLGRDDIHTHEATLAAQLASVRARMDRGARHVVVGHAFVTGAQPASPNARSRWAARGRCPRPCSTASTTSRSGTCTARRA